MTPFSGQSAVLSLKKNNKKLNAVKKTFIIPIINGLFIIFAPNLILYDMTQKKLPRGVRNHNPLNIRRTKDKWHGMLPVQTDKEFVQFENDYYGFRAAFLILLKYLNRGVCTIYDIISTWSPSIENDVLAYVEFVCKRTGFDTYHKITRVDNLTDLVDVVEAMSVFECGHVFDRSDINHAFQVIY